MNGMDTNVGQKGRAAIIGKAVDQRLDAVEAGEDMKARLPQGAQ